MYDEGCGVKLLRVGAVGQERPAVLDDAGNLRDIGERHRIMRTHDEAIGVPANEFSCQIDTTGGNP